MTNASVTSVDVSYADAEPQKITVRTKRRSGEFLYYTEYEYRMNGSTASLVRIEPDGEAYLVEDNAGTREAARQAVAELPFVQAVEFVFAEGGYDD